MMYCRATTQEGRGDEGSVGSQKPAGGETPGHLQHAIPLQSLY